MEKISVSSTLGSGSKFMIEFPLLKSKQENNDNKRNPFCSDLQKLDSFLFAY